MASVNDLLSETLCAISTLACEDAELQLVARTRGSLGDGQELDLHLAGCARCAELAAEIDAGGLGEVLLDVGGRDLDALAPVSRDLYVRGPEVGRGGMGRIVRARDRRLGRAVAIKELLDERLCERFEREARLTARLQHPGIVNVHEAGRWEDGAPFYAMKFVAGRPLGAALAEGRSLADRLAFLPNLIAAVDAIAYAHAERVIHRDLNPANILIGAFGETVVVDWGLAKDLSDLDDEVGTGPYRDGDGVLTRAGAGTPRYMPPEQERGETPDERADVYALGATLYHLVTGHPPDEPLAVAAPDAPIELAAIIGKAMAPDPARRYADASELADELKAFAAGRLVRAHQYTLGGLLRRWLRRNRAMVTVISLAVWVALVGGTIAVVRVIAARAEAEHERDQARLAQGELLVESARQHALAGERATAREELALARAAGVWSPIARFLSAEMDRVEWRSVADDPDGGFDLTLDHPTTFSAARGRVALVAPPGTVIVVAGSGKVTRVSTPDFRVHRVLLSPDGGYLATMGTPLLNGWNGRLELWRLSDGQKIATEPLTILGDDRVRMQFDQGSRWLLFGENGLRRIRLADADRVNIGPRGTWVSGGFIGDVIWSVNERRAQLWSADGELRGSQELPASADQGFPDASGERLLVRFHEKQRHEPIVIRRPDAAQDRLSNSGWSAFAFGPDGRVALIGYDGRVERYDGNGPPRWRAPSVTDWVRSRHKVVGVWTPDGAILVGHPDNGLRALDAETGALVAAWDGERVDELLTTARGILVVERVGPDRWVEARLWDRRGFGPNLLPPDLRTRKVVHISQDGERVLVTAPGDTVLREIDTRSGRVRRVTEVVSGLWPEAPPGNRVLRVRDTVYALVPKLSRLPFTLDDEEQLTLSPLGDRGYSFSPERRTQFIDLRRTPIRRESIDATAVSFRPDGELAAAIAGPHVVIYAGTRVLAVHADLPDTPSEVAWSPDGRRLLVLGFGYAKLLDVSQAP